MKGRPMYSEMQRRKEQGFSIRKVSRMTRISRNTIKKLGHAPGGVHSDIDRCKQVIQSDGL